MNPLVKISKMTIPMILSTTTSKEKVWKENIGPSKASCARQVFLSLSKEYATGVSGERNLSLETYAREGFAVEDLTLDILREQKRLFAPIDKDPKHQIWIRIDEIHVIGKLDGIARLPNENGVDEIFGIEIKSCKDLPDTIEEHHLSQTRIYAAFTGLPFAVIYKQRSPALFNHESSIQEFYYRPNVEDNINQMAYVWFAYQCYKTGLLPDRPFENDRNKVCGFCPFHDICWDNSLDDIFGDQNFSQLQEASIIWATNFNKTIESRKTSLLNKFGVKIDK